VGTLVVTAVPEAPDYGNISHPLGVTDGIAPSHDPVLHYRPDVYGLSYARRTKS
jgi:hypothetical protein